MVVAIGGFRDMGDPNDPRRRRGAAPQSANISGLPAPSGPYSSIEPGAPSLANQVLNEVLNDPDADRIVRPEIIEAPRKPGRGYRTRLGQAIENAKNRTGFDPRNRGQLSPFGQVISGEVENAVARDPQMRRASRPVAYEPKVTSEDLSINADGPATPLEYREFLAGLPSEQDIQDTGRSKELYFGLSTSEDPTQGSIAGDEVFDRTPYGAVDVPKIQRNEQYLDKNRELEYSRIYPGDFAASVTKDPDAVYSSERESEVRLGKIASDLKKEFETPVISETGFQTAAREGRIVYANQIPEKYLQKYTDRQGNTGSLVGLLRTDRAIPDESKATISDESGIRYVPIYQPLDDEGEPIITATRAIPRQGDLKAVDYDQEPLYRLGEPHAYNSDRVDEALRPYLPGRTVRVAKRGSRQNASVNLVRQAAEKGSQFFLAPERAGDQPIPISAEQIDGSQKLVMVRPDNSETMLFPRVDGQGNPIGVYRVDDAYESRYVGPAVMSTKKGVQTGAANPKTGMRGRFSPSLGVDNAVKHSDFIQMLAAGTSQVDPVTRDGYRDSLVPLILSGQVSMEQVEEKIPGLRPGTYNRQVLDQALTEATVRSMRSEPVYAPSTLETESVRGGVIDSERAITEGDAYDAGLNFSSGSELEGIATTEREQRMNDKVLAALGIQDSGAIGLAPSEMSPAQAAYIADVMRRNRAEGGVERLDRQKGDIDSIYAENPAQAAEVAYERRRNRAQGGQMKKGALMGGPVRVVRAADESRNVGTGVTGQQASFARALRDYYQRQAPGLPYDESLGTDQATYSDVAFNLGSEDPAIQEQAMRDMQGVMRGRQIERKEQPPEMGEFLNAPKARTTTQPSGIESARQRAMRFLGSLTR